ncbi:hypothetical protein MHI43_31450 [Paenibacillus sp. FSL H8-0457]|uniref:hypothetical protein n=1 Tax=unclassified Paenibacillus TaxID=185978 RepID=UPI0003E252D6|nr:hypothetical protein [Paenibacillus sp. FSL H8-457]ETT69343.1 hypothetical protein C172_01610 [Paenibacillus sp. FSL H8-457]
MSLELHKALPDSGGHGQAVRGTVAKTFSCVGSVSLFHPNDHELRKSPLSLHPDEAGLFVVRG